MKKKKLLGKIVSLVLAAALTVTALPTSGMEVLAAEQVQTETEVSETAESAENKETSEDESSQAKSEEKSEEAPSTEEEKASEAESEDEKKSSEAESETEEKKSSEAESETEEKSSEVESEEEKTSSEADNKVGEDVKSPVVTDSTVTFNYVPNDETKDATKVRLAGSMTNWGGGAKDLEKNEETGVWSITIPNNFKPGKYEYKFIVGDDGWTVDNKNLNPEEHGNSVLWIPGLLDGKAAIQIGKELELPKLNFYSVAEDGKGTDSEVSVTYDLSDATKSEAFKDKISLNGSRITIASDFPEALPEFTLNATATVDAKQYSATLTVTPQKFVVEKSPVIEDGKATFYFYAPSAENVGIKGQMTGDSWPVFPMTLNDETKWWEFTIPVSAGRYEYGFEVGANKAWATDAKNPFHAKEGDDQSNSVFWVAGLEDSKVEATSDGEAAELPKNLKLWTIGEDGKGTDADVAVTYALSAETEKAEYKDLITLTAATETAGATVSLKKGFPQDVKSFTLTATDAANHTSTITVDVVAVKYKYTIYCYDPNHTWEESALWIWEEGGSTSGEQLYTGSEQLADGNTWLKAEVELSYTNLGIIARSKGGWDWKATGNLYYKNKDKAKEVTLYIVADDTKVYTKLPEIVQHEDRYLLVEYKRDNGSAKNWSFYTWNNGFGENFYPFEEVNGSWIAKVPVKPGLSYVSYCIERADVAEDGSLKHWAEKDGNDYNCSTPEDQTVIKIVMEEGQGITKTYPYNVGYELAPKDKTIHFYYRNNGKFLAGETDKYTSVAVEINGKEYPMTFDEENQRYTYDLEKLEKGTYRYRYVLKETAESEKAYELDRYNARTEKDEAGIEYSVVEYGSFDAVVDASVYRPSMDYNDNNVLTIKIDGKKDKEDKPADISGLEVAEATADLSALGGSSEAVIDPELLELTISVKQGISAGEKVIPVTLYDQFKNEYKTNTTVTVTDRNKGGDFDWDEAVIYFAVTDRFFDGNESNNTNVDKNGPSSYHGGDFAGLTQKLDYLKDLGVNTIWITPIVANDMADGLTTDVAGIKSWGYHGYWASDFEKLDSHLGTEQEFATLLSEAHNRGIKIMVDVVLNHSGYEDVTKEYFNTNFKDADGNPIRMLRNDDEMVNGSDQKASLSDLPDFLTEKKEVRELLVAWQSNWISKYDIDYYRVDTVKHVDDTTWSAFKNALTKKNPKFKMIGEWAGAGYATDTGALRTGRMDSLLDFDFNNKATDFVTGNISGTEGFLCSRNGAIDNTATLGQFIGSHDEDGFVYHLYATENEGKGLPKERAEALGKVAASLQITAKGQPVIYYGEEIGMTGANNYPYQTNRNDFEWSKVTDDNKTLTHYKKLLAIRNQYSEVFAKGTRTTIEASNSRGIDVFARSYNGTVVYTALNISDNEVEYTFEGQGALKDIYSGTIYKADAQGNVVVKIPAAADGGTAIFINNVASSDTDPDAVSDNFWVDRIPAQIYTGKAITIPADQLNVYFGQTLLKAGSDYTVKYSNNKDAGAATITIKGKGNYADQQTINFSILPKPVDAVDVVSDFKFVKANGLQKPTVVLTFNKKKLKSDTDYEVVYYKLAEDGTRGTDALTIDKVTEAGNYDIVVKGKGNFTGEKAITNVSISDKFVEMKKTKITLDKTVYDYTGSAIKPTVKVTYSGNPLTENEHYTVRFDANKNAGTAKVIITGNPAKGYFGTVTKTFKINGVKLASVAQVNKYWKSAVDYDVKTGKAVQPAAAGLELKNGNTPLKLNKDYTVSYQKNTKPGTASVIFTGTGKYTGTIKKTFKINKIAFSQADDRLWYKVAETTAPYNKKGAKASVLVSYNSIMLKEGKDYKLSYKDNKKVGDQATITISGIGDFTGSLVLASCYKVVPADLSTLKIVANDVVVSDKPGKFMSAPVITDASGTKLAKNKDYTVEYYRKTKNAEGVETEEKLAENATVTLDNGAPVTIKVVATAVGGNYVDGVDGQGNVVKAQTTYRVVPASIANAKFAVNDKKYTGKEIKLTAKDFTQAELKDGTKLTLDKDFVIDSYVNNVKKGTASVTIKGIGNYGGTKKVTFKITSRDVKWWWNLIK